MAEKGGLREMQEQLSLRRSPRLSTLPDSPSPNKKAKGSLGNEASRAVDDKCMRRSPRLASHDGEEAQKTSSTFVSHNNSTIVQVHASLVLFFFLIYFFILRLYFFGGYIFCVTAQYLLGIGK